MIPVACIHGAMRSRLGMEPSAAFFRAAGHPSRTFGFPTRSGTLAEHGQALARFWERWYPEPPPIVGVFAHSMGGLVTRAWLGQQVSPAQEQRIVMLSPPNRGSALARALGNRWWFRWAYGDAAQQLQGETVEVLPALPSSARVLVIAGGNGGRGYSRKLEGDNDGVVAVAEMLLPGAHLHFAGGFHSVLQWRRDILAVAQRFFESGNVPG